MLNEELDNKILALYGLGTSYVDISDHLQEIYDVETQLQPLVRSQIDWYLQ